MVSQAKSFPAGYGKGYVYVPLTTVLLGGLRYTLSF